MSQIPVDNSKNNINKKYRQEYHEGDIEYRLRSENRSRFQVWYLPLFSITLLLCTLLIPIESVIPLSILTWLALAFSIFGKIAQNQLIWDVRDFQDIRDVSHQGRLKRHYELASYLPQEKELEEETIETQIIDPIAYFDKVSTNWRTHLGVLSPTDTGKTSTLEYFMSLYTAKHKTLFIAIEPKDNKWQSLPAENVIRIKITPTPSEYNKIVNIFNWVIERAENRKTGLEPIDYEIILNLEEYLTTYNQIKTSPEMGTKQANFYLNKIKAIQNVGRSLGVHIVMISQSPVADDLGMSGGERSNMRLMMLGSNFGGFEAIERNIKNGQLVSGKDAQEKIKNQFDYWKPRLKNDRHPMIMANFIGGWEIFPMPLMSESDLKRLRIHSLSVNEFEDLRSILNDTGEDGFIDSSVTLKLKFDEILNDDLFT